MYVLIADSGSTKTDWVLLKNLEVVKQIKTIGFNPYFQSAEQIMSEILSHLKPYIIEALTEIQIIHYYGTGCSTSENCQVIEDCLRLTLNVSEINVSHDLLAAARALCKNETGIACILGTGSNSCLYDGKTILENIPSYGYLWGDYGSGAQIGKLFIQNYFEDTLPIELKRAFEEKGYNRETILTNVYKKNMPSRYLATISMFVGENKRHPFIENFLFQCFDSFFVHLVNKYTRAKSYKVHTVGSVGFYYKDFINKIALRNGYEMGNVLQSPIEGLIAYHSSIK